MGETKGSVAKARIVFVSGGEESLLLSRKNAEGKTKHGQLEMLGGHLERDEKPLEGLIRELREEEQTGALADHAERHPPPYSTKTVDDDHHHLFEMRLPESGFAGFVHDPAESLGFELVPLAELQAGAHWDRLTWRTQRIFEAFGFAP